MIALIAGCGALNDLRSDVTSPINSLGEAYFPPSPTAGGFSLAAEADLVAIVDVSAFSTACEFPLPPPAASLAGVVLEAVVAADEVVLLS